MEAFYALLKNCITFVPLKTIALVVQRIERWFPKPKIWVRFPSRVRRKTLIIYLLKKKHTNKREFFSVLNIQANLNPSLQLHYSSYILSIISLYFSAMYKRLILSVFVNSPVSIEKGSGNRVNRLICS